MMHFLPVFGSRGSDWILLRRSINKVSLLFCNSDLHFEMVLLSRIRAADSGIFFWKNDLSSARMARLIGGLNISSAI